VLFGKILEKERKPAMIFPEAGGLLNRHIHALPFFADSTLPNRGHIRVENTGMIFAGNTDSQP
jgi:hypothetical protein